MTFSAHRTVFAKLAFFAASLLSTSSILAAVNCKSVDGVFSVNVNHCVQGQAGCVTATVSQLRGTEFSNPTNCDKILEGDVAITGCINNLSSGASHVIPLSFVTGPGIKTVKLVTGCIDVPEQPILFKSLHRLDVQVLASAPIGTFSNIACALTSGATTCSSQFRSETPSNMRWSCLWSKSQVGAIQTDVELFSAHWVTKCG